MLLLLLLAACDGGRRERLQLEELERQNRADSLMTNDSLAMALANYFDRHGTPNEQLRANYRRAVKKLGEAQNTILRLRSHEAALNSTIIRYSEKQDKMDEMKSELENLKSSIKDYEDEIERQKLIVADFQRKQMLTKETVDQKINQSEIYKHLRTIANQGKNMTDEDWSNLMQLVISLLPGFYRLISSKERVLSRLEYQICVLDRLGIEPRRMHYLLGCSESYVSIIRGGLHKKIFDSEASRKEFSSALSTIC